MKKLNQKGLVPSKNKSQSGFSIIEVLIVLAIAGLIMLVVFLAVPALQRNARNNGRLSDAQKFAAAVNQCISNNNGKNQYCQDIVTSGNGVVWDVDEASQLEIVTYGTGASAPTALGEDAGATPPRTATNNMVWRFGYRCEGATATKVGATTRQFVVVYNTEGKGNPPACISS